MSTAAMKSLADIALALRDEQLQAKVVLYKSELRTSPELDAITDKVVQELKELQAQARAASQAHPVTAEERANFEIELIRSLKEMLGRTFRPGKLATSIERKLGEVTKRFVRVFFKSELADKIRGAEGEMKAMRFPEQALFHALLRCEGTIFDTIDGYQFIDDEVRVSAQEGLHAFMKELRSAYLARTTPELNTLVAYLNETLGAFFTDELPPILGELALEVVKEARLADRPGGASYKISAEVFPTFRQAFEKNFLERLVVFTEQEMLERVRVSQGQFREETIRFVADPVIFSDVCEVVCDSIYDMLYNDGFLDLPSDWRARLSSVT